MSTTTRFLSLLPLLALLAGSGCVIVPGGGGTGPVETFISWRMPAGINGCVGPFGEPVADMLVTIDGRATSASCAAGLAPGSIRRTDLSVGTHTIDLQIRTSSGFVYYRFTGNLPVQAGGSSQVYDLQHITGSLALGWRFFSGSTEQTCASAGISHVDVNLVDQDGNYVYRDTAGAPIFQRLSCVNANGVQARTFPTLYIGNYRAVISAYRGGFDNAPGTGMLAYQTRGTDNAEVVTVTSGLFFGEPNATSSVFRVPLY